MTAEFAPALHLNIKLQDIKNVEMQSIHQQLYCLLSVILFKCTLGIGRACTDSEHPAEVRLTVQRVIGLN